MSAPRSPIFWIAALALGGLALLSGGKKPESQPTRRARSEEEDDESTPPVFLKDDVEVLGRVIHSEIGRGTREQKLAVAWVVRNLADQKHTSIWKMLCDPCGRQEGDRRPASTRLSARRSDIVLAAEVLAMPETEDPTGGATQFVNPRHPSYPAIRKRWTEDYKWQPYMRLGKELELWGPSKTP